VTSPDNLSIRLETSADGLVLIADVDGRPAAAISYADGQTVGDPAWTDCGLVKLLRAYRWAFRGVAAVWVA
jgi:hypothetical protein